VWIDLHPEVQAELRAAALWYEERRARLGDEFLVAVSTALEKIAEAPGLFPHWIGTE
jgi:hypothetical protein